MEKCQRERSFSCPLESSSGPQIKTRRRRQKRESIICNFFVVSLFTTSPSLLCNRYIRNLLFSLDSRMRRLRHEAKKTALTKKKKKRTAPFKVSGAAVDDDVVLLFHRGKRAEPNSSRARHMPERTAWQTNTKGHH